MSGRRRAAAESRRPPRRPLPPAHRAGADLPRRSRAAHLHRDDGRSRRLQPQPRAHRHADRHAHRRAVPLPRRGRHRRPHAARAHGGPGDRRAASPARAPRERSRSPTSSRIASAWRPAASCCSPPAGTSTPARSTFFEHPYLDAAVGEALLDAGVRTIAIDTLNADFDRRRGVPHPRHVRRRRRVHRREPRRHRGARPPAWSRCSLLLPLNLVGCDGAPVRAVALEPAGELTPRARPRRAAGVTRDRLDIG